VSRIDVNELKTYQQVYIYLIPILGNLGFINIIVVIFRVRWFEKHLQAIGKKRLYTPVPGSMANLPNAAPRLLKPEALPGQDPEAQSKHIQDLSSSGHEAPTDGSTNQAMDNVAEANDPAWAGTLSSRLVSILQSELQSGITSQDRNWHIIRVSQESRHSTADEALDVSLTAGKQSIRFAEPDRPAAGNDNALYIPPPWRRDKGIFNQLLAFYFLFLFLFFIFFAF